jgi:large subunit ribosomal protein L1
MQHSKRYRTARTQVDPVTTYPIEEAVKHLASFPKAKFDETVELAVNLGVDPKQSNQMVRGIVNLPKGSGKKVRVIVFTENPDAAKAAGADEAGLADLLKRIEDGWMDFDVAVSTTSAMKEVRRVARILGPRGLMPNPKTGTVTFDVTAAIKDIKLGGRVEFKMDKTGNVAWSSASARTARRTCGEPSHGNRRHFPRPNPTASRAVREEHGHLLHLSPSVKLDSSIYASF